MTITVKIMSKKWTIKFLSKDKYKRRNGKDSLGITYSDKRKIEFSPEGTNKETIAHELVHAYLAEIGTHCLNLDEDSMEEMCAELFSKRGHEILKLSSTIFNIVKSKK